MRALVLLLAAIPLAWAACSREGATPDGIQEQPYDLQVPAGWPPPPLRADNPLTAASVQLGKALFFDQRLSLGRGLSCATCHRPALAFSDSAALSIGVAGLPGNRNAPSLANVAYHPLLLRDGGAPTLEQQVFVPLFDSLELDSDPQRVVEMLRTDPHMEQLSRRAYGRPLDLYVLTRAIANYMRTLLSGHSRYDLYLGGDSAALTAAEVRGMAVFTGAGRCTACHSGFDLSDHTFHNTGITVDAWADPGRQRITLDPADRGRFKTPTLRNIALTAPYMHDGSMATLEAVVEHYGTGGLGDPNTDSQLTPLHLSPQQKADLLAFLHTLTDLRPLDPVE